MTKLKINTATAIVNVINSILFFLSWLIFFVEAFISNGSSASIVIYGMAGVGLVLSIIACVQSKKYGIKLAGSVLGIIGNACMCLTGFLAFPAMVLLIISSVFLFMQKPVTE